MRSLFLFSAPLYGRELARGLAPAPCLLAALFPLAACAGFALLREAGPAHWLPALLATVLAALVALSATLRDGWRAALYRGLAFASAVLLTAFYLIAGNGFWALVAITAIACAAGFAALRAFGETLARFDPILP